MRLLALLLAIIALSTVHVCADHTFRIVGNNGKHGFYFNVPTVSEFALEENPLLNVMVGEKITFRIEAIMSTIHPKTNEKVPYAFGLTNTHLGEAIDFSSDAMGGLKASSSCTRASNGPAYYTTNISDPCILTWTVVDPGSGQHYYYVTNRTLIKLDAIVQQVEPQSLEFHHPQQQLHPQLGNRHHPQLIPQEKVFVITTPRARGHAPSPYAFHDSKLQTTELKQQQQHQRKIVEEEMAWNWNVQEIDHGTCKIDERWNVTWMSLGEESTDGCR